MKLLMLFFAILCAINATGQQMDTVAHPYDLAPQNITTRAIYGMYNSSVMHTDTITSKKYDSTTVNTRMSFVLSLIANDTSLLNTFIKTKTDTFTVRGMLNPLSILMGSLGTSYANTVKYLDTAAMLAIYQATINNHTSLINLRFKYTDTTSFLKKADATNIYQLKGTYQPLLDTAAFVASILSRVYVPTAYIVSRTLNTNFTPSITKQSFVVYTITCTTTNPLLVGTSTANVYLEYSLNAGTTWLLPSQNGASSGVGVTVTLQLVNGQTSSLSASIPINALVRIRTTTTGTGTVSFVTGQETY